MQGEKNATKHLDKKMIRMLNRICKKKFLRLYQDK